MVLSMWLPTYNVKLSSKARVVLEVQWICTLRSVIRWMLGFRRIHIQKPKSKNSTSNRIRVIASWGAAAGFLTTEALLRLSNAQNKVA